MEKIGNRFWIGSGIPTGYKITSKHVSFLRSGDFTISHFICQLRTISNVSASNGGLHYLSLTQISSQFLTWSNIFGT